MKFVWPAEDTPLNGIKNIKKNVNENLVEPC